MGITTRIRWGFKGRNQLPLFMMSREEWTGEELTYARVLFNSMRYIGI